MALQLFNIVDANIDQAAAIKASKLEGEFNLAYSQTGEVVADTQYLRVVRGATGLLVDIEAAITEAIATGGDRTVDVDLQKSSGGGAFATVLSSTIQFTNGSTLRAISTGSFSATSLSDGDILRMVVTVAGSAGAQAQGLAVSVTMREDASP